MKALILLVQLLFIARFHVELAKLNAFVEPVSTLRKITNPLVLPVKKLFPNYWSKLFSIILVAYLLSVVIIFIWAVTKGADSTGVFWVVLVVLLSTWVMFLKYGMILFVIMSWVTMFAGGANAHPLITKIAYILERIFQPLLRPIQRFIPSFGGIDVSPIVFFIGLMFIEQLIVSLLNAGAG